MNTILKLDKVKASIDDKLIINDFNLDIGEGEIHVIMGPNGSGKSTLSKVLAGHPSYEIQTGNIYFNNENLLDLSAEERSHHGLFLAFQYPIEIAGVTNYDFLRIAYNERQKYLNQPELDPLEFMNLVQILLNKLKMRDEFLNRNLNEGFSGGEKKRNEILQMLLLDPKMVILDEIDSGLDIDALRIICENITSNLSKSSSVVVITHYPRILEYLKPDFVHIHSLGSRTTLDHIKLIKKFGSSINNLSALNKCQSFFKKIYFF